MRKRSLLRGAANTASLLVLLWILTSASGPAPAAEEIIWQLGKQDYSDHEFLYWRALPADQPVIVRLKDAEQKKLWPSFHPGSGNGAMGGRPHPYTLLFDLAQVPRGTFYLDLGLLFRHPRIPVLRVEVNGHTGTYFLSPKLSFKLGDEGDAFNPIHASQQLRIALPARYFRSGENRLTLTCLDDPPTVTHNVSVGGPGDSGLYYDSLALSQDPRAAPDEALRVSLEPTVFFRKSAAGISEECWLTLDYSDSWKGGKLRFVLGSFSAQIDAAKDAEFGETRYKVLVPDGTAPGVASIEITDVGSGKSPQSFSVDFAPRRKWKVFYAPNEHLDIGFTDYQAKVAEVLARQLDKLLAVYQAHPDYRFNLDGSWIIEQWLATRSPDQARRLAEEARAGRVAVNAFYANFLTQNLSLEELFRGLYFSKQLEASYGLPFDFANVTDVPSYSWSLPSILAAAGIRYFAAGGNQTRGPLVAYGRWNTRSPFWWEGPDGQRVLAWYSYHYHQLRAVFGLPPAVEAGASGLAAFLQAYERNDYAPDAVLLYGTEVENVPFDYQDAALAERWNAQYAYPRLVPCRFADYFRYVEENYAARLPVVRGDSGAYWEDGAGTDAAATSRYRLAQTRALAAESLAALTASLTPGLRFPVDLARRIWRNLLLYGEHTFTSYRGPRQPQHDEVTGQLKVKDSRTIRASEAIDELMRHGQSQLADRITTQGKNLIVFNPLSWRRSGLVRFDLDRGTSLTDLASNTPVTYEVMEEHAGYQTIRFWARDVPSLGYKVYRLGRGTAVLPGRSEPETNIFQNRFYRITLDPERAAIKSIYDKELKRELVDSSSPYLANEYLYVTGGGSEGGRGEGAEATQLIHLAQHLPFAELTVHHLEEGQIASVEKTVWGHRVRLATKALHTPRIETEILLLDNEKRIEIRNHIHKDLVYAKEAAYFAFPWAASDPTFRYDIANGWVNPEEDLLEGGDSEWFAAQNWVNTTDGAASITLAVVDAPLVSLGDINRGRWPQKFSKTSATVFSYALNNYWFTNTPAGQSGDFTFRYAITSGARFDPQSVARFAREARSPLEISELRESDKRGEEAAGTLPTGEASLVEIEPENLMVSALKGAEDGKGLVVRVLETAGKASEGKLTFPQFGIASARESNALEVAGKALESDAHSVRFSIKPHQVLTIRLLSR
jgi:alpha-mannosidase